MKKDGFVFLIFVIFTFLLSSLSTLLIEFIEQETRANHHIASDLTLRDTAEDALIQLKQNFPLSCVFENRNTATLCQGDLYQYKIEKIAEKITPEAVTLYYLFTISLPTEGSPLVLQATEAILKSDFENHHFVNWKQVDWQIL